MPAVTRTLPSECFVLTFSVVLVSLSSFFMCIFSGRGGGGDGGFGERRLWIGLITKKKLNIGDPMIEFC